LNPLKSQELEIMQQKYEARLVDLESELERCKIKLVAAENHIADLTTDNRIMVREREELLSLFRGEQSDLLNQRLYNTWRYSAAGGSPKGYSR